MGATADGRWDFLVPHSLAVSLPALLTSDLIPVLVAPRSPVTIPALSATGPVPAEAYVSVVGCLVESEEDYKRCTRHVERERKRAAREKVAVEEGRRFSRLLARAREQAGGVGGRFLAVDVENYEHNQEIILEIGWSIYDTARPLELVTKHYLIEENLDFANRDYVPDNRHRFAYGVTSTLPEREILIQLLADITGTAANNRVAAVIGHAISGDVAALRALGLTITSFGDSLPYTEIKRETSAPAPTAPSHDDDGDDDNPYPGCRFVIPSEDLTPPGLNAHTDVFDTADLDICLRGRARGERVSLKDACAAHGVRERVALHNAGNDAHLTMLAFLAMVRKGGVEGIVCITTPKEEDLRYENSS
ncbi:hypothetical protein HK101_011823 [Irineochytrium annulatum]|nr:hypothetical protein HK101_011823 [Irineochytrium annulatum]